MSYSRGMLGIVKELAALALVALVALNCVRGAESVAPVDDPAGPELSATEEAPSQATIAGFVVDEASGEGVEGVRVELQTAKGDLYTTSHPDGSFSFPPQAPGAFTVRVVPRRPWRPPGPSRSAGVDAGQRWRPRLPVDGALVLEPEGSSYHPGRIG